MHLACSDWADIGCNVSIITQHKYLHITRLIIIYKYVLIII